MGNNLGFPFYVCSCSCGSTSSKYEVMLKYHIKKPASNLPGKDKAENL